MNPQTKKTLIFFSPFAIKRHMFFKNVPLQLLINIMLFILTHAFIYCAAI